MIKKNHKNQRGISLYLAVGSITVLLAIVVGVSTILTKQFKMIREMGDSVVALYAADTGIERVLYDVINQRIDPNAFYWDNLSNGASYQTDVYCCGAGANCVFTVGGVPCPVGAPNADCTAVYYCIKSRGYFGPASDRTKIQRAVQVAL